MTAPIALAIHGGAWNIPDDLWPAHQRGCAAAYDAGMAVLRQAGTATEAIVAAIAVMEDDPTFDAGKGSFLNEKGKIELDAGLMEGAHLRSGAVLGVCKIPSPIALANWVLGHSDHNVFTGEGAHALAQRAGLELVAEDFHEIPRERQRFLDLQADPNLMQSTWRDQPQDTVGAIALDQFGNLAAGNSTGGTPLKQTGRVGDAPLMGLGFYADNERGAFVCTGWGEPIMQSGMGMFGLQELSRCTPQQAAERAIAHLERRTNGFGGILIMAPDGQWGASFNTQRMAFHQPSDKS